MGARFILEHLSALDANDKDVVDLGCGNGVLSLKLKKTFPQARITAVDESYMATASAKNNFEINQLPDSDCQFITNNCLDGFNAESQDSWSATLLFISSKRSPTISLGRCSVMQSMFFALKGN
ncbi:23S rRNA (guanine-N-2-) -methyltransferase RlmG [Vibrio variabilis]|uniref:23S rRNA (Guanine-N-2-) -methyltransferase RlmG n=1 Tax=Vibrio variabilis TaxID=990271 RepID=A0ABQ0JLH6_9VIBR|nr:23S rRNA (guanine-N-2-) -methyltransferase RlmG [Vibrio variabilis]